MAGKTIGGKCGNCDSWRAASALPGSDGNCIFRRDLRPPGTIAFCPRFRLPKIGALFGGPLFTVPCGTAAPGCERRVSA
ncbi:MAG: hypothetical protein PHU85_18810 [Phycisphaerae bacterium]|nr:hypothetical protein [Phycisphaerae bacterium]